LSRGEEGPDLHPDAWISDSARITGRVVLAEGVSVWHNAVLRAECQEIRIGAMTNLQDFVMVHVGYDHPTVVGSFCSITHHATVHGCRIGDHSLVGPGAVLMDGSEVGAGSIVAAGCVVPEGKRFGAGVVLAGVPARVIAERDSSRENRMNAWQYHRNAEKTRRGDFRAWDGPEYEKWLAEKRAEVEADRDL